MLKLILIMYIPIFGFGAVQFPLPTAWNNSPCLSPPRVHLNTLMPSPAQTQTGLHLRHLLAKPSSYPPSPLGASPPSQCCTPSQQAGLFTSHLLTSSPQLTARAKGHSRLPPQRQ